MESNRKTYRNDKNKYIENIINIYPCTKDNPAIGFESNEIINKEGAYSSSDDDKSNGNGISQLDTSKGTGSPSVGVLSKDKEISLHIEQIKELRAEYISIQSSFLTMTAISFGGYGLVLYYTFSLGTDSEKVNYMFLALPFLFGLSFLNVLKYTIKMLGIGAYITHLEKTINNLAEKNIFAWHSKISYVNGYNFVGVAHVPINIALYIMIGIKFFENMDTIKTVEPLLHKSLFAGAIVLIVIIVFALFVCATQYEAAKVWSKRVYESNYIKDVRPKYVPDMAVAWNLFKSIFSRKKSKRK